MVFGRMKGKSRLIGRQKVRRRSLAQVLAPVGAFTRRALTIAALVSACMAASVVFAALAQTVHHFFYRSDYFRLRQVTTVGVSESLRAEMLALTGLDHPDRFNVCRLDRERIRQTLLAHPRLRAVTVEKRHPHGLLIRGEERRAVAVVSADGFFPIDAEGVSLGQARLGEATEDLPFITGIPGADIVAGRPVATEGLADALDLIAALRVKSPELYELLAEIHLDPRDGLLAYLRGGAQARFGTGSPIDKLPRLELFMSTRHEPGAIDYIDLRFERQIVYKTAEASLP